MKKEVEKKISRKKAVFFSMDALIALMIILIVVGLALPLIKDSKRESKLQGDVLEVISTLKIGEMNHPDVDILRNNGNVTDEDYNKTVLDMIGKFYIQDKGNDILLANAVLESIDPKENIGIWIENKFLASKQMVPYNQADAKNIEVSTYLVSGISEELVGNESTGFSALAYLSSDRQTKYFYFGGYIGDGNISLNISYPGNIISAKSELAINQDFDVYVNGVYQRTCPQSLSEFQPANCTIPISNFASGNNLIGFNSTTDENLHIAGGYIRIDYNTSQAYKEPERHYIPGIQGFINIYDSFYVPGDLGGLTTNIHFDNNISTSLTIGNVTIFNQSTSGPVTITNTSTQISAAFAAQGEDWNDYERKTVPVRIGMANASYLTQEERMDVDVIAVTDRSGSMGDDCSGTLPQPSCNEVSCTPIGTSPGQCNDANSCPICDAKNANKILIDIILNYTENRVGLTAYSTNADLSYTHVLSNNNVSLKTEVSSWNADGYTCICCGVNRGRRLITESTSNPEWTFPWDPDKYRSLVVMSDGEANRCCNGFNDVTGSGCSNADAAQDAIDSACDAWLTWGIKTYTVGFSTGGNLDENTLIAMANCGNGTYHYANVSTIAEIYANISEEIIKASYNKQTITFSGDYNSTLFPDSYIEFDYSPDSYAGLFLNFEKKFDNNLTGTFSLPTNSTIVETRVVSYSGPLWTDKVTINTSTIYDLSLYGNNYIALGDPYPINIPNSEVALDGVTNEVNLTVGLSPTWSTNGSEYNKIIYTIIKNITSSSGVKTSSAGCNWTVEFYDSTIDNIPIPFDYSGTNNCEYSTADINYNKNDAQQVSAYRLLELLDFNLDKKVDIKFSEHDFIIKSAETTGLPFSVSSLVQIRKWS